MGWWAGHFADIKTFQGLNDGLADELAEAVKIAKNELSSRDRIDKEGFEKDRINYELERGNVDAAIELNKFGTN